MYVCLCHRVNDRQIQKLARSGVRNMDELQEATELGRGCGCCMMEAEEILAEHQPENSVPSLFPGSAGPTGTSLNPAT